MAQSNAQINAFSSISTWQKGKARTAQSFLCRGPGGDTVDVINVHAPSSKGDTHWYATQHITHESATKQFALDAWTTNWTRQILNWRRQENASTFDVSIVTSLSRQGFATHTGANP